MFILIGFAFLAGVATIFAPCILPILPLVLSAGVTGGKQRPLGIMVGLVASFTFFTLALSTLTKYLGLDPNILRTIAIIVLLAFGILLLIPRLLGKFEAFVSQILPQASPRSQRNDFLGGVIIGISLGLVWTPCVGPIVASVITLAATSSVTFLSVAIIAAYALGTSIPLLLLIYGSQSLIKRIKSLNKIAPKLQIAFGIIMVLTAITMLLGFDRTIQNSLLTKLPSSISTGLTQQLEESALVQNQLNLLHDDSTIPTAQTIIGGAMNGLPVLGIAPEFTGISNWLNSKPLTINELKGKVVLVDFWTYSCINCIRTLPYITKLYDTYKDQGLVIVGVHTPEFAFEKDTKNVAQAIEEFKIHYPVAQDNDFGTWTAYKNRYWPAKYLIDAQGNIRYTHFGEGEYEETEAHIRTLLKDAKQDIALPNSELKAEPTNLFSFSPRSPETYLGSERREHFLKDGQTEILPLNGWTLKGNWETTEQFVSSKTTNDSLSFKFSAKDVYLVINPPSGKEGTVQVLLDGKVISRGGADVKNGLVTITTDRLYHLVHLDTTEQHVLTLVFQTPGTKAFAFTFG